MVEGGGQNEDGECEVLKEIIQVAVRRMSVFTGS